VGVSGRRSVEQPHLHFGVRDAGQRHAYRDPLDFLPAPPASEPERPAPHTAPVPVPASAPRVPALVPLARVPRSAPAPRAPRSAPAHALGPRSVPAPSLGPAHAPGPVAARSRSAAAGAGAHAPAAQSPAGRPPAPAAARVRQPHPVHGQPAGLPESGPHGGSVRGRRFASGPAGRPARPAASRGFDVGWLAACLGLVAVATLLGRPAGPRGAIQRTHRRLTAFLRPLSGRG
jgi:hypothetical protein